jgi:hypothetical protein
MVRHYLTVGEMSSDGELKVALAAQMLGVAHIRGLEWSSTFPNYTHSELRFRALLTEGTSSTVKLALV